MKRWKNSLFIDEKTGERLERRHIRIRHGRPSDGNELLGRIEPRREQVLRRTADGHATIDPEVVMGEEHPPERRVRREAAPANLAREYLELLWHARIDRHTDLCFLRPQYFCSFCF